MVNTIKALHFKALTLYKPWTFAPKCHSHLSFHSLHFRIQPMSCKMFTSITQHLLSWLSRWQPWLNMWQYTFRDILGKQRTIQPVHANEGQRIHPVRIYRMDKHYIPGKLSFFIHLYIYICFHLSLTPSCVNNKQFSVLSRKVTIWVQCLTHTFSEQASNQIVFITMWSETIRNYENYCFGM